MEQLFRYCKIIVKVIYNFLIDYDYSFVLMRESVELRCILINLTDPVGNNEATLDCNIIL